VTHVRPQGLLASLNGDGRYGLVLVTLVLGLCAPLPWNDRLLTLLRYERGALAAGEAWRLVTAHLVHLDAQHLLLNVAGVVLLWALFARTLGPRLGIAAVLAGVACIDAGLYVFSPQVGWYVGASGVLHAVVAAGSLQMLRDRDPVAWPTFLLLVAKLGWEQATGALAFAGSATVVVDAHLYGAIGGAAAFALAALRRRPISL
jgi:rhomboid family GlyGly-CTERM serine protease